MSWQLTNSTPPAARDNTPKGGRRGGLLGRLFAPVDIASLVFFRVAFGAIMLWEIYHFFSYDWIGRYFVEPDFLFTYYGFEWVRPWPGEWMYLHLLVLGLLTVFIALGFMYRLSMILFFLGFTYVFLLDQTNYLNHVYLICLISFLMIFVPAHRAFSVDARLRPGIRSETAPGWALWLLMAQVGIVYFYGGIAKLNGDWLRGQPMGMWLDPSFPVIGRWFDEWWAAYLFSYGGLLLDLLAVPFLLWRRTRPYAFAAVVGFHLMNSQLFHIGIFPWFMIAATLLFFAPSWPRLVGRLRLYEIFSFWGWPRLARRIPRIERRILRRARRGRDERGNRAGATNRLVRPGQYAVVGLLGLYLAVQLLMPLRHHLYPGQANWSEEGNRFAWNMMLRDKQSQARFVAVDPASGEARPVRMRDYVTPRQRGKMTEKPDMILQLAHRVEEDLREQGREDVEVRALVAASLNGREPQLLIDPTVDLGAERRTLMPARWIEPLEQPFPSPEDSVRGGFQEEIRKAAEEGVMGDTLSPHRPAAEAGQ